MNLKVSERTHCANCDAILTGAYCQSCGQAARVHRSLWHMAEELLHGILHFDSKAWRTLPALLLRPGQLTRDYIDGKRKRYMSPFILFLFLNFVMFLVFSYLGGSLIDNKSSESFIKEGLTNELSNSKIKLAELEAKRSNLAANDQSIATITDEISKLRLRQAGYEKSMAAINAEGTIANISSEKKASDSAENSDSFSVWLERSIYHALQNPDLALYKLKGTASKFAFILIPISLPFLWLLFIRRKDIMLFDHGVFALYSLSFMCLLLMLVAALARLGLAGWAWLLFLVVPPVHMFAQLRGTYQLSIGAALWRTLCLLGVAGFALFTYFVVITWLSL